MEVRLAEAHHYRDMHEPPRAWRVSANDLKTLTRLPREGAWPSRLSPPDPYPPYAKRGAPRGAPLRVWEGKT